MTYSFVIRLGRLVIWMLGLRIELDGAERLPTSGPAVLAANHVSFLDFLLLGLLGEQRGRRVRFLCRHEVFDAPVAGWAMRRMGHIPVDRAVPAHAYLLARDALRRGEVVGVFPEAGVSTSYTVRGLMPGAAALATDTGAPLLPVGLWGGQRLLTAKVKPQLRRGLPVSIQVGSPVPPDPVVRRRTAALGRELKRLLDDLQARPHHQPVPGEAAAWHPRHLGGAAPSVTEALLREVLPSSAVRE